MRKLLLPILFGLATILPQTAGAQDATFYNCQNDRVRIAIAPMRLDKALAKFTSITRCPVSLDTDKIRGRSTRNMRTGSVRGNLTPEQALARMLRTTPLKTKPIHGGFSVAG